MELKEICGYLPYKLKVQTAARKSTRSGEKLGYKTGELHGLYENYGKPISVIFREDDEILDLNFDEIKPILRPLSDLVKPCLEDGKIPIVELANIAFPSSGASDYPNPEISLDNLDRCVFEYKKHILHFEYDRMMNAFFCYDESDYHNSGFIRNQLKLFQKLYEWHFDIHGLIGRGDAIDKDSILKVEQEMIKEL